MTWYYEDQARTTDYSTDGRMSISEVIGLLQHLNSHDGSIQRPWIDSFHYRYDETSNKSYVSLVTMNDRPHNANVGG